MMMIALTPMYMATAFLGALWHFSQVVVPNLEAVQPDFADQRCRPASQRRSSSLGARLVDSMTPSSSMSESASSSGP